jgi:hypothetical protein
MFRVDRDKIPYLILENNKSANLRENKTCKQWGAYLCSKGTQICVKTKRFKKKLKIDVRKKRKGNHELTIQINWQHWTCKTKTYKPNS